MEATTNFELAVYLSWFAGIFFIVTFIKLFPNHWSQSLSYTFSKPKTELLIAFILIVLLAGISTISFYVDNPLKNLTQNSDVRFFIKLVIVYSPIWIYLLVKKQSLKTCFISFDKIFFKITVGIVAALIASFIFLLIRGKSVNYFQYLSTLRNYSPVELLQTFLEGFAIGFLLFRFYAVMKPLYAAAIVAVIFMLSHIPSYITGMGISVPDTLFLIAAHTGISFFIFYFLNKTRDVISIFFIHWFINAASDFTSNV